MVGSVNRAGLPETGTSTAQRSGQGSKTAARTQAHKVRADLDDENGVIRYREQQASLPPHPCPFGKRSAQAVTQKWPAASRIKAAGRDSA